MPLPYPVRNLKVPPTDLRKQVVDFSRFHDAARHCLLQPGRNCNQNGHKNVPKPRFANKAEPAPLVLVQVRLKRIS